VSNSFVAYIQLHVSITLTAYMLGGTEKDTMQCCRRAFFVCDWCMAKAIQMKTVSTLLPSEQWCFLWITLLCMRVDYIVFPLFWDPWATIRQAGNNWSRLTVKSRLCDETCDVCHVFLYICRCLIGTSGVGYVVRRACELCVYFNCRMQFASDIRTHVIASIQQLLELANVSPINQVRSR